MAFDTLPSIDMRQNSPDIFGDLRSILQSPSGSGWRAFKHFVETIPDPRDFFDNQLTDWCLRVEINRVWSEVD